MLDVEFVRRIQPGMDLMADARGFDDDWCISPQGMGNPNHRLQGVPLSPSCGGTVRRLVASPNGKIQHLRDEVRWNSRTVVSHRDCEHFGGGFDLKSEFRRDTC